MEWTESSGIRQVRNWFAWYLQKKSSILSVSETSLGILSCAITRSLGYNGHKEVPFSSWTVKLPVICNQCMPPIVCRITSKNYLDDLRWHHYCISFSGERGVFSQYQDGIKTKTETGIALGYDGLLSWVKEPVMNSSSLALICGIGFFLQKKSNKWRIPSLRELELSRTGLISQTLPNPSALWKCFPHPSTLLRLSLRRQNPRPHHRQEIIPRSHCP